MCIQMYSYTERNQRQIDSQKDNILLWISRFYYLCKEIELLESPLGTNETIGQVVSDISEGYYKDCIALWYSIEDKRITLAFANKKERGNQ